MNEDEKEKDDMQNKSEGNPTKDEKEVKRIKEATTSEDQKRDQKPILKSKGFSITEDLAEKRKRIMQKIVHDLPTLQRAGVKTQKRSYDMMKKRTFERQKKRYKYDDSSDDEMKDWLVDDDEEEEDTSENSSSSSDSEIAVKKESTRLKSVSKLRVSIQLEGMETIMEIQQYRLRLLCSDSSEEEEEEKVLPRKPPASRAKKLEKVGKRIKRIVSEDSDEEEDEDHLPRKCQPPPKPPSAISKLPRM